MAQRDSEAEKEKERARKEKELREEEAKAEKHAKEEGGRLRWGGSNGDSTPTDSLRTGGTEEPYIPSTASTTTILKEHCYQVDGHARYPPVKEPVFDHCSHGTAR